MTGRRDRAMDIPGIGLRLDRSRQIGIGLNNDVGLCLPNELKWIHSEVYGVVCAATRKQLGIVREPWE